MSKQPTITTVASGYYSTATLNLNFDNIKNQFDNFLSLDGSTPNAMQADIDINGNDILNVGTLATDELTVRGSPVVVTTFDLGATDSALVSYYGNPSGTVERTVQDRLRELSSVKDYGAAGDGSTDDTVIFQQAIDNGQTPISIPEGDYIVTTSSLTGQDRASGSAFLGYGPTINGQDQKHGLRGWFFGRDGIYSEDYDLWLNDGFNIGVNDKLTNSMILVTAETENSTPLDGTKSKVGYSSTVRALGGQHADGARFNLLNSSSDGNGNTGVYCQAVAGPLANWSAAVHGETRHEGGTSIGISSENASYANTGSFFGMVLNNTTAGAPDGTPHAITGTTATVKHDTATALLMAGTAGSGKGEWRYGIRFRDGSLRAADGEGIRFEDEALYQIRGSTNAVSNGADIIFEADSQTGIILNGDYTSGNALRITGGTAVAWEATGSAKTFYETGTSRLHFALAGTPRVSLELDPTPILLMNGTAVLGTQQSAIANPASSTAGNNAAIISILGALRAHGLIAT